MCTDKKKFHAQVSTDAMAVLDASTTMLRNVIENPDGCNWHKVNLLTFLEDLVSGMCQLAQIIAVIQSGDDSSIETALHEQLSNIFSQLSTSPGANVIPPDWFERFKA